MQILLWLVLNGWTIIQGFEIIKQVNLKKYFDCYNASSSIFVMSFTQSRSKWNPENNPINNWNEPIRRWKVGGTTVMLEPVLSCMLFYKCECGGETGDLK